MAAPDAVALVDDAGASFTYAQLDVWSNRIANGLISAGRQGPVIVVGGVQPESIAGMLGVLKAGCLYAPLDPTTPAERVSRCCDVLDGAILFADRATAEAFDTREVRGDRWVVSDFDGRESHSPGVTVDPETPAFVVFTSGSTGEPKAVWKPHSTVLMTANAIRPDPSDRFGAIVAPSAAAASGVYISSLVVGAAVYFYDLRSHSIPSLGEWLRRAEITMLLASPSVLRALKASMGAATAPRLGHLVLAGELVKVEDYQAARAVFPHAVIENAFGSAEAGGICAYRLSPAEPVPSHSVPPGDLYPWVQVTIVDDAGHEVPQGKVGRIVARGRYVAGGYWEDAELSTARFRQHADGTRSLASGDLGRFEEDGRLAVLGRADTSVKIRGQLVDPLKVEAALHELPGVAAAVVSAVEGPSGLRLVAHVVAGQDSPSDAAALSGDLRRELPPVMVPTTILFVPGLPMTPGGKVDRQRLAREIPIPPYVAPSNPLEERVARVVARVLDLERVGMADEFSALGADSLSSVELMDELAEEFGVTLDPTVLLAHSTVGELARLVADPPQRPADHVELMSADPNGPPIVMVPGGGGNLYQLEPLAQRLPARVVVPVPAGFNGGKPDRRIERMAESCAGLVERQPAPRIVVGYSFGALVAHKVATTVEDVALLVLIDPPVNNPRRWAYLSRRITPRSDYLRRRESQPTLRERWLLGRVAGSAVLEARLFGRYLRVVRGSRSRTKAPGSYDSALWFAASLAAGRYRPEPFGGRTLIVHRTGWERSVWGPDLLTGTTREVEVPADHHGMLREPFVAQTAEAIARELADLGADSSPIPADS